MADQADVALAPEPVSRARLRAFYLVLGAALSFIVVPMAPFLVIPVAWPFLAEELGIHQFHDVGVAAVLWLLVIGTVAQTRSAERQVGGMQQVLIVVCLMLLLTAYSRPATLLVANPLLLAFALFIVAGVLHPARAQIVRRPRHFDPFLTGLALLAAIPMLTYAYGQLRLDHSSIPTIAHGGHWTAMAVLIVSMVALALLSATRPSGYRIPVWSVGFVAVLFGTAAAALPHMASSVGPAWGTAMAVWAIIFVVVAELRFRGSVQPRER